jgi:primosomal protein N' (replication factor Y)
MATTIGVPQAFWSLLERVSDYYLTPLHQVLQVALPKGILPRLQRRIRLEKDLPMDFEKRAKLPQSAQGILQVLSDHHGDLAWHYLQRTIPQAKSGLQPLLRSRWVTSYWVDAPQPRPKLQQAVTLCQEDPEGLPQGQREALILLKRLGGDLWVSDFLQQTGVSRNTLQSLVRKGRIQISQRQQIRFLGDPAVASDQARDLTLAQRQAVETIQAALGSSQTFLLQGVTGSGKTEVYLQVITQVLARQQSALVLVPEIGLTPQLTDRFRARFGSMVRVYHSGLSAGERYDTWHQMLSGHPQVLIATRSGIFAPLPDLGILILDEEHDDSYKQDQPQPCYHARTVARWRSELESCPLLLGTATPALETYSSDQVTLLLPNRIQFRPLPPITLVDLREELISGNRSMFSQVLQEAIGQTLDHKEQVILFVPRRGYSTFVLCRSCGSVLNCQHCDVSLSFHQIGQQLRCHYCGDRRIYPQRCPECGSPYLKHFGTGTQKVLETVETLWPKARVLRFDSDSTQTKGSHRELLSHFQAGEADILVGTQMVTKGLDVANVTLVGILAADGLFNQADFRATERTFQTLTQVAGRAGRGETPGRVILQTYLPEHPVIQAIQHYDQHTFLETELHHRRDSGYPPYRNLILLRLSSQDPQLFPCVADEIALQISTQIQRDPGSDIELLGPCPAQVERVSGWYRWQILLKFSESKARQHIQSILLALKIPSGIRFSIDVDPLRIL